MTVDFELDGQTFTALNGGQEMLNDPVYKGEGRRERVR